MPNELQKILVELADKPLNVNLGLGEKPVNMNINIPGLKGVDGTDGRNGADGLSAYDIAQLEGFRGTRQEWLESLKAKVELPNALTALKRKNIYLPNAQLDTILTKLIELMGNSIDVPVKPLEFDKPLKGQFYINVYGTPHFKVALRGKGAENGVSLGDDGNGRLNLDSPFMADDIELEYFNLLDKSIGTYRVSGYSDVKTELGPTDFADSTITEIDFPEVTTIKDGTFNSLWKLERVNLPKVKRIGQTSFSSSSLTYVSLPMFSLTDNSLFDDFLPSKPLTVIINESSKVDALITLAQLSQTTVFNQNQTKRFDKISKSWVVA